MATIHKCDGCGRLSPDENECHIANNWAKVFVKRSRGHKPWGDIERDYLLCDTCMGFEEQPASGKLSFLDRIRESLWWFFLGKRLND